MKIVYCRYEKIFQELKETYQISKYHKKIQILTLSPFTINKTMEFFNASKRMVRKSRKLKEEIGILPEIPSISKGVVITNEQKSIVEKFYESDEISRCCPGMKEYLTIRNADGEKVKEQKRLLLGNLKELFQLYKSEPNNPKIGFSTFAKLRPKYCVLAGSGGTHSVCVCTYHQNVKLQLAAIGDASLNYKDLMNYSVCSTENSNCMMHMCKDCPREEGIKSYLELLDSLDNHSSEINYSQWVTVDRCTMVHVSESLDEYIDSLSKKISFLTRHHYIAQAQSKYFKELKNSLIESEAIVVGDFSENYSFIVQDAIQGFHWENSQCTVHPFVLYYKNANDPEVRHTSFCILSDATKHNTVMVYAFLYRLLPDIKIALPTLKKVHYFSDGCAGQYKNRYNFSNICHHEEDFNISCEWNFFATSHGKSSCDGIGGTVKRAVARASLQRICRDQILTPQDMFEFCIAKFDTKIKFYFVPELEVEEANKKLKQRYEECRPIAGTQKYHRVVPLNKHEILCYHISSGTDGEKKVISKQVNLDIPNEIIYINKADLQVGTYVGCIYEKQLWFAIIENYIEEFDDYTVSFLHPPNISLTYGFPERVDHCAVPYEHIVKVMSLPTLKGGSRINYIFNVNEVKECFKEFKKVLATLVK